MNYTEAVEYIESTPKFTKKNKPENTAELIRRIGNPERRMKVIHVAGTNGKGSVCAFLASILGKAGKRTGLFTSPHLVEITERFQVDQVPVSHETFTNAFARVKREIDAMIADGYAHPAYFELLFAAGLLMFEEAGVEYLVLETGLGGRLDATNLVERPIACVLTSISLDHMEYLGNTVAQIAAEKAGIIKEGVPVIYDGRNPEAERVILSQAKKMHAPTYRYDDSMCEILSKTDKSIDFMFDCSYDKIDTARKLRITVPFLAEYQIVNSSLAAMTAQVIGSQDMAGVRPEVSAQRGETESGKKLCMISDEAIAEGIRQTRWQGRMETVLPGVVLDGAHNADGIREFIRTAADVRARMPVSLLFSAVVEKEYEKMIREICEDMRPEFVVVTQVGGARVVPADTLAEVFRRYTKVPVIAKADVAEAFEEALARRGDSMLFCAGSLYLVGELKGLLLRRGTDD